MGGVPTEPAAGAAGVGNDSAGGDGGAAGGGSCPTGFSGPTCSVNIDDCVGVSCGAHGHCVDQVASYQCVCDGPFTGSACDLPRIELLTPTYGMSCGNAISGDGNVVVGYVADNPRSSIRPFRWTEAAGAVVLASATEPVDYGQSLAVSADGSVVAGYASLPSSTGAFRWTSAAGITLVGPGDQAGLSSNGGTVVGRDMSPSDGTHFFRWTAASGERDLGVLGQVGHVLALSGDGTTIVGQLSATSTSLSQAYRWTAGDGIQYVGPGSNLSSAARAVTADGRIVVGDRNSESGGEMFAFRWDRTSGAVDLDLGSITYTSATGITSDGSVIVGTTSHDSWIWSQAAGARLISTLLTGFGVDPTAVTEFRVSDVSDDGTVITGCAFTPTASGIQAFIARVGE